MSNPGTPPGPSDMEARIAQARASGYSWDDIHAQLAPKIDAARKAGYTDEEINRFMGLQDQQPMNDQLDRQAEVGAAPAPKEASNSIEAFKAGIEGSSAGLLLRDKLPDYAMSKDPSIAENLAAAAGSLVGDAPAALVGGVLGFVAGSEAPVVGNVAGAMAGGFALPATIRETYAYNLKHGRITSAGDFAKRFAVSTWAAAKGAATGLLTAAGGAGAEAKLAQAGAPVLAQAIGKTAAELGIMTNVSTALEGRLAEPKDYLDAGVSLALMHAGVKAGEVSAPAVFQIRNNVADWWAKTGEHPAITTAKAMQDPVFRAKMQADPQPQAPSDSSVTPHEGDEFVIGKMPQHTYQAFHGTNKDFQGYDLKLGGEATGAKEGKEAAFFTSNPDVAESYATFAAGKPMGETSAETKAKIDLENANKAEGRTEKSDMLLGQVVRPVQVSFNNPKVVDWEGKDYQHTAFLNTIREAKAAGHDGVIFQNVNDSVSGSPKTSDVYASFKPDEAVMAAHEAKVAAEKAAKEAQQEKLPRAQHERELAAIQKNLPPVTDGYTRLWRGNRKGEVGQNPSFTNDAAGIALPFQKAYGGKLSYVDVPTSDLDAYESKAGAAPGAEFLLPKELASQAKEITTPVEGDPWATVAARQADVSPKPPWIENAKSYWNTFYREFIRKDSPLEPIYAAAEKGTKLPPMDDPRTWMRLQELSNIRAKYMIERKMIDLEGNVVGPGLNEIVKPFEKETGPKNFWTYSIARWAKMRAEQEKETGVEVDAAKQVVDEGAPKYEKAFQQLMTFQNQSLKYLADSGMLSQDAYNEILKNNEARIPGYRVGKGVKGTGAGKGLRTFNSVKAFLGSEDQIKNVQESILRDTFLRTELANRNKAKINVVKVGEKAGLAVRDNTTVPVKFDLTEDELNNLGIDAANSDEDLTASIWRRVGKKLGDDVVPFFEDGKMKAAKFEDPAAYKFLNGLDTQTMSSVAKVMATLTKPTRAMIVLNPAFPIHIMEYDLPFQAIMKGRFTPADFATGAKTVVGRLLGSADAEARYEAALRNGALAKVYGQLQGDAYIRDVIAGKEDPAFHSRVWNAIKTPYDMLRAWAQMLGDMQKVGRFERGLKEGEQPLEAGLRARGAAYHDPYVGGNLTTGNNRIIMFLGAYVNGMDQTLRAALGRGTTTTGDKLSATKFWTRGAAIITLPMLANWWMNKDKDWYKAQPDWQKDRGLSIPIGDPDHGGHVFFYPMPQLLSFIFGTVPLRLARAVFEQDPHAFDGFGGAFAEGFVPSSGAMLYSLATPLIEQISNHSFWRDRPLVSQDTQNNVLAPEQYSNYSSGTAKFLSKMVNDWPIVKNFGLSPPVIDNYITGIGGTIGTYFVRAADMLTKDENQPASKVTDWPGISSFFARYPSASAQPIQDFMDRMDDYNRIHGSLVKTLEDGDMARFKQIVDDNPSEAVMHLFQLRGVNTAAILPENLAKAQDILQTALLKSKGDMASVQTVLQVEQGMKVMRAFTKLVGMKQTPQITEALNQIQQQIAPGSPPVKGKLTPNDKTQLLDQGYAWMQQMSEHGMDAMDKAGFK